MDFFKENTFYQFVNDEASKTKFIEYSSYSNSAIYNVLAGKLFKVKIELDSYDRKEIIVPEIMLFDSNKNPLTNWVRPEVYNINFGAATNRILHNWFSSWDSEVEFNAFEEVEDIRIEYLDDFTEPKVRQEPKYIVIQIINDIATPSREMNYEQAMYSARTFSANNASSKVYVTKIDSMFYHGPLETKYPD
ncbi:hypothetical protein YenMTG1_202 [Yersinia phage vB_YenM_TG1]|uniref:Uncharacterized protein n=1 Tax=Yersinia phage vB_YenM_TG1 TaxID=1589265 RepID=A0A0B4ZXH9_9CAUD|nr:hypothetical protein AVV33_gp193 [Yersinia phage vB_YenM_TG1]AJD82012.1 hypothetical protein YenMTG1_202 [Yersinia phage vB_YenM_TG1]